MTLLRRHWWRFALAPAYLGVLLFLATPTASAGGCLPADPPTPTPVCDDVGHVDFYLSEIAEVVRVPYASIETVGTFQELHLGVAHQTLFVGTPGHWSISYWRINPVYALDQVQVFAPGSMQQLWLGYTDSRGYFRVRTYLHRPFSPWAWQVLATAPTIMGKGGLIPTPTG